MIGKYFGVFLRHRSLSQRQDGRILKLQQWRQILLVILAMTIVCTLFLLNVHGGLVPVNAEDAAFQSAVWQRDRSKPQSWVFSEHGGEIEFGPVTAVIPHWFTNQGGANVFGDMITDSELDKPIPLLPETEFAFGIWPSQVQTEFEHPIEFRITLNAALFVNGGQDELQFRMYDPGSERWIEVPSEFSYATYQIVASVQKFTPVPDDFPDWGGRTFFGLFRSSADGDPQGDTPPSDGISDPVVNRGANIRSGPGTNYAIVRQVPAGTEVEPVARTRGGRWLELDDGTWIAKWLVDNVPIVPVASVTPTPAPRRAPTATLEPTTTDAMDEPSIDSRTTPAPGAGATDTTPQNTDP